MWPFTRKTTEQKISALQQEEKAILIELDRVFNALLAERNNLKKEKARIDSLVSDEGSRINHYAQAEIIASERIGPLEEESKALAGRLKKIRNELFAIATQQKAAV